MFSRACKMSGNFIVRLFTTHPNEHDMSYPRHFVQAWWYALQTFCATLIFLVHGLFPFLFVKTGSNLVQNLSDHFTMLETAGVVCHESMGDLYDETGDSSSETDGSTEEIDDEEASTEEY